jgi:hypothetical protein
MSDGTCDVSLGDYEGDPAEVYHESAVKARKPHQCNECREPVPVSATYTRVSGKWDGEWSTWRFCAACWEALSEFSDGGKTFGVLWDEMQNNWAHGAHLQACLNRLTTAGAKQHMTRQWRKWKKLES